MILTLFVAFLHFWFMVLESFLWTKPIGLKTFGNTPAQAAQTRVLALNQGLYNGFFATGLVWSVFSENIEMRYFLLGCVIVAGIVGALTVSKKILFIQSLPAAAAIALSVSMAQ